MEKRNVIDQSLIDQQVNSFIEKVLLNIFEFSYTTVSYSYCDKDFYLKVVDQLIPEMYVDKDGFYRFSNETLARLNTSNVNHYAKKSEEEFFEFLKKELSNSVGYRAYINRLGTKNET